MADIRVVTLRSEEWRLFKQIRLEAVRAEPQAFTPTYEDVQQRPDASWQERLAEAQAGQTSWLLFAQEGGAQAGGHIVGMIGAHRDAGSDTVEIISVYVAAEKRGQGVGGALMAAILAAVRRDPAVRKAVLGVNKEQSAAVALYRRFGFQVVGEKSGVMGDGKVHSGYVMEKELG